MLGLSPREPRLCNKTIIPAHIAAILLLVKLSLTGCVSPEERPTPRTSSASAADQENQAPIHHSCREILNDPKMLHAMLKGNALWDVDYMGGLSLRAVGLASGLGGMRFERDDRTGRISGALIFARAQGVEVPDENEQDTRRLAAYLEELLPRPQFALGKLDEHDASDDILRGTPEKKELDGGETYIRIDGERYQFYIYTRPGNKPQILYTIARCTSLFFGTDGRIERAYRTYEKGERPKQIPWDGRENLVQAVANDLRK